MANPIQPILIHDTIIKIDTLLTATVIKDSLFDKFVDFSTIIIGIVSILIALWAFLNQRKISKYEALSKQPNLIIKEKILIGADDGNGTHLLLWNNGLGVARLINVHVFWNNKEIKNLSSLATAESIQISTDDPGSEPEIINLAIYEMKVGQAISANEGFPIINVIEGRSYQKYIKNFTKFELGIRKYLKVELEYESLFGIKGKIIKFPEDCTSYINDNRQYAQVETAPETVN